MLADQQKPEFNSSVRTSDAFERTCQERWSLETDEERESREFLIMMMMRRRRRRRRRITSA